MNRASRPLAHILWRGTALLALLLLLSTPNVAAAQSSGDPLVIPESQVVKGNIATTSQSIEVRGSVLGDVTSWSGNITVTGHVSGDVVSYSGQVTLAAAARVDGNVLALDGGIERGEQAMIAGQALGNMGEGGALGSLLDLFTPQSHRAGSGFEALGRVLLGIVLGVLVLAFCTVCAALWPRRTGCAALALRRLPVRSLVLGLLTTSILGLGLLPLMALLGATIIGLPLVAALVVGLNLPYIYGLATLIQALSTHSDATLASSPPLSRSALSIALGVAVLVGLIASVMPAVGLLLVYLLASPGLGAVLLCRGGVALPQPT